MGSRDADDASGIGSGGSNEVEARQWHDVTVDIAVVVDIAVAIVVVVYITVVVVVANIEYVGLVATRVYICLIIATSVVYTARVKNDAANVDVASVGVRVGVGFSIGVDGASVVLDGVTGIWIRIWHLVWGGHDQTR